MDEKPTDAIIPGQEYMASGRSLGAVLRRLRVVESAYDLLHDDVSVLRRRIEELEEIISRA